MKPTIQAKEEKKRAEKQGEAGRRPAGEWPWTEEAGARVWRAKQGIPGKRCRAVGAQSRPTASARRSLSTAGLEPAKPPARATAHLRPILSRQPGPTRPHSPRPPGPSGNVRTSGGRDVLPRSQWAPQKGATKARLRHPGRRAGRNRDAQAEARSGFRRSAKGSNPAEGEEEQAFRVPEARAKSST